MQISDEQVVVVVVGGRVVGGGGAGRRLVVVVTGGGASVVVVVVVVAVVVVVVVDVAVELDVADVGRLEVEPCDGGIGSTAASDSPLPWPSLARPVRMPVVNSAQVTAPTTAPTARRP